jgi:Ca-activated chloride channel family protein
MISPAKAGRHVLVLTAAFLCAASGAVLAQATFTAGTRTVAIFATVASADGLLARDLEKSDFTVDDNGKAQPITIFANEIQPITVVLLLDRSGSMRANFSLVEKAAEQFVDVLGQADKARIGSFSNRIEIDPAGRFASSHDLLLTILRNELQEEGPTPLWNAVNVGITALLHQDGRRVILVFTDGMDRPGNGGSRNSSLGDVMKRAEEENVMVYAVGLAGSNRFAGRGSGARGGSGRGGFGGGGGGRGGGGDRPDPGLPKLAAATGGGYFELTTANDLAATFRRVADELHHQYALGFTPAQLDGKLHTLQVRVARDGAVVHTRRSYLAAKS